MDETTFVYEGTLFTVEQEENGKFVVDIALAPNNPTGHEWARVVGQFNSQGDAITAAKAEIRALNS